MKTYKSFIGGFWGHARGVRRFLLLLAATVVAHAATAPNPEAMRNSSEWPLLGENLDQWDFSPLAQINDGNVGRLGLAWYADLPLADGLVGQPLVMDGTAYEGAPGGQIIANDVRTGKLLWSFKPDIGDRTKLSFAALWATHFNRGLAIDRSHAYIAAGDCRLFAVDRHTGKQVWEAKPCDPTKDYGIVGAPRVGDGMVFIGNTNAEMGTARCHVDAFDAATGRHLWRFYTMPGDPAAGFESKAMEMASKTWGRDYWKRAIGAAAPWDSMAYDAKLKRLYVGVGNPVPFNPDERGPGNGDELFSNSIVALDGKTGKLVWYYQEVPRDGWDGDATAAIMIADLPIAGRTRRVVMQAAKDGFFYVIDAETGKFLSANKYVPNNWASRVNPATGRIEIRPNAEYWKYPKQTIILQPGRMGGHSWTLTAYNPVSRLAYIPAFILPNRYTPQAGPGQPRKYEEYYGLLPGAEFKAMGKLIAWDPIAQRERWHVDHHWAVDGGVLATGGNVVFQGTADGTFEAYAALTGRPLWRFNARGTILAAPITVEIGGKQLILVPAGDSSSTASARVLPRLASAPWAQSRPRLLAFSLNGTATLPPNAPIAPFPKPFLPPQPDTLAAKGEVLFHDTGCYACHGEMAEDAGTSVPDLRRATPAAYQAMPQIVIGGAYRQAGMPAFPNLTKNDLRAIQAFLTNMAWKAYDQQQTRTP